MEAKRTLPCKVAQRPFLSVQSL